MAAIRVGTTVELAYVYGTDHGIDTAYVAKAKWAWDPSSTAAESDSVVGTWTIGRWLIDVSEDTSEYSASSVTTFNTDGTITTASGGRTSVTTFGATSIVAATTAPSGAVTTKTTTFGASSISEGVT